VQNDPTYTEESGEKKCVALRSALKASYAQIVSEGVIVSRVTAKVSVQSMHPGKACLMLKSETWHENSRNRWLKWFKIVEVVSALS